MAKSSKFTDSLRASVMAAISAPDVKARMKDALVAPEPDVSPSAQTRNVEDGRAMLSPQIPAEAEGTDLLAAEKAVQAEWSGEPRGRENGLHQRTRKSPAARSEPTELSDTMYGLRGETTRPLPSHVPTDLTSPRNPLCGLAPSRLIFLRHVLANRARFDHEFTPWARVVQDTGLSLIGIKRTIKDLTARGIIHVEFDQLRRSGSRVYIREEFAKALEALDRQPSDCDPTCSAQKVS